jgi:hypothetical protein
VTEYPKVIGEFDTAKAVVAGKSIARLGDGELKHCDGEAGGRQIRDGGLTSEMRELLKRPHADMCVGIPTMDPTGPKFRYRNDKGGEGGWYRHEQRFLKHLHPGVQYYSAFVSRPDSAPWIYTREFAELYQQTWAGKKVFVVGPKANKVVTLAKLAAKDVRSILCPHQNAYSYVGQYEREILAAKPDVALLTCGPAATVLAHRLCKHGIQALDFGSGGTFMLELLMGKPRKENLEILKTWKRKVGAR